MFINETVPHKIVALIANKLYKEHYVSIPTKNSIQIAAHKKINYAWKIKDQWNGISLDAATQKDFIEKSSIEEFIFERYYGFTKLSNNKTQEYRINHPKWMTHKIIHSSIYCDFGKMYGKEFVNLNYKQPDSVLLADGSNVSVNWKRLEF